MNNDLELARHLQKRFDEEQSPLQDADHLNSTQNLVHPDWETLDPTPDVHRLFAVFSRKFFQDRLACVTLEWSKRMYQCAGICYQRRSRVGMDCTIRLSEPLLKLRSRKDLVETLLHEMIHAYCFVLGIREGNGGHGPSFVKIMTGINRVAGTNITVYHSFHDEVKMYKTHWWRCDGVCQDHKPYFGFVKRTSNRAPGPNDFWFAKHQATCGGNFIKVKEPEPKKKSSGKENKAKALVTTPNRDIRDFFGNNTSKAGGNGKPKKVGGSGTKPNFGSTTVVVRKPPTQTTHIKTPQKSNQPSSARIATIHDTNSPGVPRSTSAGSVGGNLQNVRQFKDLNETGAKPTSVNDRKIMPKTGGQTLGGSSRNTSRLLDEFSVSSPKRVRLDNSVVLIEKSQEVIDLVDEDESHKAEKEAFLKSLFNGDDFEDIELIDAEFDDNYLNDGNDDLIQAAVDPTHVDNSIINDIFDTDTLMEKFKTEENNVECPLCGQRVVRDTMLNHFQTCPSLENSTSSPQETENQPLQSPIPSTSTGITNLNRWERRNETNSTAKAGPVSSVTPAKAKETGKPEDLNDDRKRKLEIDMLRSCGYSEEDILKLYPPPKGETQSQMDRKELDAAAATIILDDDEFDMDLHQVDFLDELKPCPVCNKSVRVKDLNTHLDKCLQASADLFD